MDNWDRSGDSIKNIDELMMKVALIVHRNGNCGNPGESES